MFDEEEPGKPKNWGCTVAIIVLMMTVNITVLVICRVLLDTEDEFNEPILHGELRDNITAFLGVFSMTFCFGCCCCFCCGGDVFRWMCRCHCGVCFDVSRIWSGTTRRKSSSRQTSDDELDNMILATNGIPTVCSEVALNVDGNFLSECPHRAFSNQAFSGCLHESRSGAAFDMELTRSIAYAAAAPPAHPYDRLPSKQHRSKSMAF